MHVADQIGLMPSRKVSQDDRPCELHLTHRPITIINELHHVFPQELQRLVYDGVTVDGRVTSICATGHNTVTRAWQLYLRSFVWPSWCVGSTRDVCELGWERCLEACAEKGLDPYELLLLLR